jgi:NADPH:quinone reductase-like Zn-dependent oxidoreductase
VVSEVMQWARKVTRFNGIGTCSARIDYVKNLGADEVLDYNAGGLKQLKDASVDPIFDCVGGDCRRSLLER